MFGWWRREPALPRPEEALPGRPDYAFTPLERHRVNGRPLVPPYPEGCRRVWFGMGCFWGAERLFWGLPGIWVTAVGYGGGWTPHPTYEEVITGRTGHVELVQLVYRPEELSLARLLGLFWEHHDPTQGMRQGFDVGTQYRSAIYTECEEDHRLALESRRLYERALSEAGWRRPITTEIRRNAGFYFAEPYHQQYLARHPDGYCGLRGTGVAFPDHLLGGA